MPGFGVSFKLPKQPKHYGHLCSFGGRKGHLFALSRRKADSSEEHGRSAAASQPPEADLRQ